jgi:hypothetical protein
MEKCQYEEYQAWVRQLSDPVKFVFAGELWFPRRRLLMHGYDGVRNDLKVWSDPDLGIGVQWRGGDIEWRASWTTSDLYPSKRAYPDRTDYRFAVIMAERHEYPINFTNPAGDWE